MTTCRVCGDAIRDGEDVLVVEDATFHAGCVEPHREPRGRRVGAWAAMGSRGQMAMGAVQRDASWDHTDVDVTNQFAQGNGRAGA